MIDYLIHLIAGWISGLLDEWSVNSQRADPSKPIRLSIFNHAFAPLGLSVVALIVAGVTFIEPHPKKVKPPDETELKVIIRSVCVFLAIVGVVCACFRDHSLVLSDVVQIRKIFGTRTYRRDQIVEWGFEYERGRLTQTPPDSTCVIAFSFDDGSRFERGVSAPIAMLISQRMGTIF